MTVTPIDQRVLRAAEAKKPDVPLVLSMSCASEPASIGLA